MTRGIGIIVSETPDKYLFVVTGLEGFLKTVWLSKQKTSFKKVPTDDGVKKVLMLTPFFARKLNIPDEIVVLKKEEFFEIFPDFYADIRPVLEPVAIPLRTAVNFPGAEEFIRLDYVPFKYGKTTIFVPLKGVVGYCPNNYVILANTTVMNPKVVSTCKTKVYKSFTFSVNGKIYFYENGRVYSEDDIFEE